MPVDRQRLWQWRPRHRLCPPEQQGSNSCDRIKDTRLIASRDDLCSLQGAHKRDEVLLFLRAQLCAENQVEELYRVFQGQKAFIM
jgi:hypothetical protein